MCSMKTEYRPSRLVLSDIIEARRRLKELEGLGWTSLGHAPYRVGQSAFIYELERRDEAFDWILGDDTNEN